MASKIETPEELQVWMHYAGGRYVVVGIAIDSCTDRPSVVYRRQNSTNNELFVRDLGDWLASVDYQGRKVRRFIRVTAPYSWSADTPPTVGGMEE